VHGDAIYDGDDYLLMLFCCNGAVIFVVRLRATVLSISISSIHEGACNAPLQRRRTSLLAYRIASVVGAHRMHPNGENRMAVSMAPIALDTR
jgi:hypothetical protein